MNSVSRITELADSELDTVAGGLAGGLVNVVLNDINIQVLEEADIDVSVLEDVTIRNVANNLNVSVGAIIQVLGGGAAIRQRQLQ
jgi:hypothetical protein